MPEYRTSSYTIYVDLPEDPARMLLVHGYSGAYDLVSANTANYLRAREFSRAPKPLFGDWAPSPVVDEADVRTPSTPTLETLTQRGYLTSLTVEEEIAFFQRVATHYHDAASRRPSYVFMPTYDCNLRCFYCFQDHMRSDPKLSFLLRTMTPELIDRIFAAMPGIEDRHDLPQEFRAPRDIGLFGGEPLLRASRGVVERIMDRAHAAGGASFWAISNATQLDAYEDLLGPTGIASIQVTLDGPPAEHDKRRIHADGSGSFELIADHIDLALARGTAISVRMNVDRANIAQLPALADAIIARGWNRHPSFGAYSYPIHAANEKTARETTFNPWELDTALDELRLEHPQLRIIDRPDDRIKNAARRLFSASSSPTMRAEFCGAHSGMYIFDALGDIFACWERTGDSKIRIGRVLDDGGVELNSPVLTQWRTRQVANVPACRRCRYALHCGGGCAVLAEGKRGNLHANFCDAFGNRFRAMVGEAFLDHESGVAVVDRPELVCDL